MYFIVLSLTFMPIIHFEFGFCVKEGIQVQSFSFGNPVVPALFVEEIVLSPIEWSQHPCQNLLIARLISGHSVLFYYSVFVQLAVPHCLNYYRFIKSLYQKAFICVIHFQMVLSVWINLSIFIKNNHQRNKSQL